MYEISRLRQLLEKAYYIQDEDNVTDFSLSTCDFKKLKQLAFKKNIKVQLPKR